MSKRTIRKSGKSIKCNRPTWRKEVKGREGIVKFKHKGTKIKTKKWIKIK